MSPIRNNTRPEKIILISALVLGLWVRFYNLEGAGFLKTTEFRTLNFSLRNPFLFLAYKIPVLLWGPFQEVAIYTTAFWGEQFALLLANIVFL